MESKLCQKLRITSLLLLKMVHLYKPTKWKSKFNIEAFEWPSEALELNHLVDS